MTLDQLWVWDDRAVARALGWYRDVAENRMPAKFRIAATIPAGVALDDAPEEALWDALDRLTPILLERRRRIRSGARRDPLSVR